jgi:hypothetical protein
MQKIYIICSILLWSVLTIQAQVPEYIEPDMFTNTVKYKAVKAPINKSPHLNIRIDKALAENKLIVSQIGFRYSASGVEFALYFKQPIPNLNTNLALVIYDKSGNLVMSRGMQNNANEYKKEPQIAYIDYLATAGDVVILRLVEATKIAPATQFDYIKSGSDYKWATATLSDDVIPPPPMMEEIEAKASISIEELAEAPKFELPKNLQKNKAHVFRAQDTGLYGYFRNDTILVPFEYDYLDYKYADFMIGKKQGKMGAINGKGEVIIPFEYANLSQLHAGFIRAAKTWGENGLLNQKNEVLVPVEYREMQVFSDSIYIFKKPNLQVIYALKKGPSVQEINRYSYEDMGLLMGGDKYLWATSNGKQGVITIENKILVPFEYKRILWVKNNLICFEGENRHQGIVNFQRKKIIEADRYKEINTITKNPNWLLVAGSNFKYGAVDTSGRLIIPTEYGMVWNLDTASFIKTKQISGDKWTLWNTSGKQLSSEMYAEINFNPNAPNLLFVQHPDKTWQFLNRKGEVASTDFYKEYYAFNGGITITLNDRIAVFNSEGKQLTGFDYINFSRAYTNEEAEALRKKLGLPDSVKLICMMNKPNYEVVVIDNQGKEYPWKY